MRLSRLRILLLTLLLAVVTLWITNQQTQPSNTDDSTAGKPLAYSWQAINTTIWKFSPQEPNKQTIIHAENIHYKDEIKMSEFTQPNVTIIEDNSVTTLTSVKGHSVDDQFITLNDNVIIRQSEIMPASPQEQGNQSTNQPTTIKTESLSYNSDTNKLSTDAKVSISQYNGETTGTGLRADLTKSEYELLSDVKGSYHPQNIQPTTHNSNQLKGQ